MSPPLLPLSPLQGESHNREVHGDSYKASVERYWHEFAPEYEDDGKKKIEGTDLSMTQWKDKTNSKG